MDAPLELLHVIERHPEIGNSKDHSGALTPNAQESLLDQLSSEDEALTRAAREQGRVFLNRLRERALAAGVASVDMRQRHGHLDETLHDWQSDVRLFVLGRRGESASASQRDLGRNVERAVRALERPVLVATEVFREPQRVLIAIDGSAVTRRGIEMVAASPLLRGLPLQLLMPGKTRPDGERQMQWASEALSAAGFAVQGSIVPGDAESVIAKTVQEQAIDLLIMRAYARSPLQRMLLGSKTSDLLRASRIPTLLLR